MATKRTGRKRSGEGEGKGDSIQSSEPIGALETGAQEIRSGYALKGDLVN
jgi:hypothetical protein